MPTHLCHCEGCRQNAGFKAVFLDDDSVAWLLRVERRATGAADVLRAALLAASEALLRWSCDERSMSSCSKLMRVSLKNGKGGG